MKKFTIYCVLLSFLFIFSGCKQEDGTQILATTKPVYEFATILCEGTPLKVDLLISENVSCLHDYTLQVNQMRKLESAELIIINGAGFEDFLADALPDDRRIIDCSANIELHCAHSHSHDSHTHENDPHIWLSIDNGRKMAEDIYAGLCKNNPEYTDTITSNFAKLIGKFDTLSENAQVLKELRCRELITFHDGFSYFADSLDLHIIKAIEEESGSEASAQELISIIQDIKVHNLPAIFTEVSSSSAAASIIRAETGIQVYALDMALSERSYFDAMEHNIKTLKEALG